MIQENEIPKYLKSTESNISKSNRKSKHKHHYEECLIQNKSIFAGKKAHLNTGLYTYCTICGKINERFKENKSRVIVMAAYTKDSDSGIEVSIVATTDGSYYARFHNKNDGYIINKEITVHIYYLLR